MDFNRRWIFFPLFPWLVIIFIRSRKINKKINYAFQFFIFILSFWKRAQCLTRKKLTLTIHSELHVNTFGVNRRRRRVHSHRLHDLNGCARLYERSRTHTHPNDSTTHEQGVCKYVCVCGSVVLLFSYAFRCSSHSSSTLYTHQHKLPKSATKKANSQINHLLTPSNEGVLNMFWRNCKNACRTWMLSHRWVARTVYSDSVSVEERRNDDSVGMRHKSDKE